MQGFAQILTPATWMSIQDGGRKGMMHLGIPASGYMDHQKAHFANEAVKNVEDAACLEIFGNGCIIRFSHPTLLGMASDGAELFVNEKKIASNCGMLGIHHGDVVSIKNNLTWTYLAIVGGWHSPIVLGSKSMMKGISPQVMLTKGQVIPYKSAPDQDLCIQWNHKFESRQSFKVVPGPEFSKLKNPPSQIELTISPQSGRHATILEHNTMLKGGEISSGVTIPGTIQMTPDGSIYVLNRDAQTTGGYYRIGFIASNDLDLFNRNKVGERISLEFDLNL